MKSIAKGSKSNFFGSETYDKMSKRKSEMGIIWGWPATKHTSIWLSEFNSTCTSWLGVVSRGKHEQYRSSIELVSFTSCAGESTAVRVPTPTRPTRLFLFFSRRKHSRGKQNKKEIFYVFHFSPLTRFWTFISKISQYPMRSNCKK